MREYRSQIAHSLTSLVEIKDSKNGNPLAKDGVLAIQQADQYVSLYLFFMILGEKSEERHFYTSFIGRCIVTKNYYKKKEIIGRLLSGGVDTWQRVTVLNK